MDFNIFTMNNNKNNRKFIKQKKQKQKKYHKIFGKIYKVIVCCISFFVKNFLRLFFIIFLMIIVFKQQNLIKLVKKYYDKYINTTVFQNKNICEHLILNGIKYSDYNTLQSKINNFCNDNNKSIDWLKNEILQDGWIKNLSIRKDYRNTLIINIIEYTPFAIWIKNSKELYLIDQFGDKISIDENEIAKYSDLLLLKSEGFSSEDINSFFNLLLIYNDIAIELKEIERIGNRRWNLIFRNGTVVKFPDNNKDMINAWRVLNQLIQNEYILNDIEEVDLRVKGKVFLKYRNPIAEKIKNKVN